MNLRISANNFILSDDITEAIEASVQKNVRLIEPTAVHVYIEKNTHHNKGDIFSLEVDFYIPRKIIRARVKNCEDIRSALPLLGEKIKKQVIKYKDKKRQK